MKMPSKDIIIFFLSGGLLHKSKIESLSWQKQVLALLILGCEAAFTVKLGVNAADWVSAIFDTPSGTPSSPVRPKEPSSTVSTMGNGFARNGTTLKNPSVEEWEEQYPVNR